MVREKILEIKHELPEGVTLVAVSKFQPNELIQEAYDAGQRVFGENRPQEMARKYDELPKDIQWHFIGHLQTNKIKMIIPFVGLIHSIDSMKLAEAVSREAEKAGRVVEALLQVHIAAEQTKQGFLPTEIDQIIKSDELAAMKGIKIVGLMGMATFTDDKEMVRREFETLSEIYRRHDFKVLSMGMSEDYDLAVECGSNMIRIGSDIFGARKY